MIDLSKRQSNLESDSGSVKGVADPLLYVGMEGILPVYSLLDLITSMVYANLQVTRDSLEAIGRLFGESRVDTTAAISEALERGTIQIDGDGIVHAGDQNRERLRASLRARFHSSPVWDGAWVVVLFPDGLQHADVPENVRSLIRSDHLGELREGVWMRPDNLGTMDKLAHAASSAQSYFPLTVQVDRPRNLAATLWDLDAISERSAELLETTEQFRDLAAYAADQHIPRGWMLLCALGLQVSLDPLLPPALLPPNWSGNKLPAVLRATGLDMQDAFTRHLMVEFEQDS